MTNPVLVVAILVTTFYFGQHSIFKYKKKIQ